MKKMIFLVLFTVPQALLAMEMENIPLLENLEEHTRKNILLKTLDLLFEPLKRVEPSIIELEKIGLFLEQIDTLPDDNAAKYIDTLNAKTVQLLFELYRTARLRLLQRDANDAHAEARLRALVHIADMLRKKSGVCALFHQVDDVMESLINGILQYS